MELTLSATTVFEDNYNAYQSDKRFLINVGGSRSSKTISICQLLIMICLNEPDKVISVVRKTFPTLRATAMRDLIETLKDMDLYIEDNHSKTENIYTFPNGSYIQFFSCDDEQKLRGRKHDIVWCNEANELLFDDFQQLNMRCTDKMIFDYNPSDMYTWLNDLITRDNAIRIHSTYKDNPFLPQQLIDEIEELKNTDENYYKIYALGLPATAKSTIYTHWQYIDEIPEEAKNNYKIGVDFGYTHNTGVVKTYLHDNKLYVEELLYKSKLTSQDLISILPDLGIKKSDEIYADYARPEIIEDIRRAGYNIRNANKNVKEGIDYIKTKQLFILSSSANLVKEIMNYKYKTNGDMVIEEPVKIYDDLCFVGSTLITTDKGLVPIKDINAGDMVLTSDGYKKVLRRFNNGKKQVTNYTLVFEIDSVTLDCTNNHLIKTSKEWKEISQLQSGMMVYQHKPSVDIQETKLVEINALVSYEEEVYDLEVEDVHEYFANGILVHNCDPLRYSAVAFKNRTTGIGVKIFSTRL